MQTKDLRSFLKVYSSVPTKFIDDMFVFYNESTSQTDYVIDLNAVAKWLHIPKEALMKTLRYSYKLNIDYIIKKPEKTKKHGGHNKLIVLLTPDCFKRMCMRSRGKKAEDVRTYFIQLEAMIIKYKDQLILGMQEDIKRLERNQKKVRGRRVKIGGYIYIVRASEKMDSVYKIGRTKDLHRRLREHESSRADDLEVMHVYRTDDIEAVEACIKGSLIKKKYRSYREVFKIDIDVLKKIVEGCEKLQSLLKTEKTDTIDLSGGSYYMCAVRD